MDFNGDIEAPDESPLPPPRPQVIISAADLDERLKRAPASALDLTAKGMNFLVGAARALDDAVARVLGRPTAHARVLRDVGPDTTVEWSALAELSRLGNAVCLIKTNKATGTGFLIAPDAVLTNNHVFSGRQRILAEPSLALQAQAIFNYVSDGDWARTVTVELAPELGFLASSELDYAVCRLKESAGDRWGVISLARAGDQPPSSGDDVFVIQHPHGNARRIALSGNMVTKVLDQLIQYTTDTNEGSSGSPVFDYKWGLVALHHAYRSHTYEGRTFYRNEGYRIPAIRADMARRSDFGREIADI